MKEHCVRVHKITVCAHEMEGKGEVFSLVRKYTPLYEKGIKKTQNKSMETTHITNSFYFQG